tara:strand:+ start:42071 stop:42610 length:540 start_codon:yes stop_codon:yes gene_type:complete
MGVILLNITTYKDYNYYVYSSFKIGGDYIYVTKYTPDGSTNARGSFTFHTYQTEQITEDNILVINEMTELFTILLVVDIFLLVLFLLGAFIDEWKINEIYRRFYKTQITRHKDVDFIYYVLNKKVIKKVPNTEEGRYSDNIENISHEINHYTDSKNFLDDFKGTLLEQRENSIKDVLDN